MIRPPSKRDSIGTRGAQGLVGLFANALQRQVDYSGIRVALKTVRVGPKRPSVTATGG